ncbi:MAG: hypothetical protein SF053_17885, partial [Bacteroidia bacterium]|nr:hypothetical protein [Bacteroidia bacterium]
DVGYLAKPFTPEEIIQLASKATYDWQRLQNLEKLLFAISGRTFDVAPLTQVRQNGDHDNPDTPPQGSENLS